LDFGQIEQQFDVVFADYFTPELDALEIMQADGLLVLTPQGIKVDVSGRLLIRNICMVFDKYLAKKQQQFSKVI
jgi:oxygen-independent coproporphyrinogen-3 oxidase